MAHKIVQSSNLALVPVLDEERFSLWKIRIKRYMWSLDKRMPECLTHGPFVPTKVSTGIPAPGTPEGTFVPAAGEIILKPENEWTDEDKALDSLDRRASHILSSAMEDSHFEQIAHCETAKEIWDDLIEYFEGDDACKDNKLYNCILAFDTFKKDPKEELRVCQNRFTKVLNDCKALGKVYSRKEVNMRFLSCLGSAWHVKVTTTKDSKDLNTMTLKNLISNLTVYESELKALQDSEKHIKSLSLQAQTENTSSVSSDNETSADEDDQIAFMARKFPKYRKFYNNFKSKQRSPSGNFTKPTKNFQKTTSSKPFTQKASTDDLLCFNCRKPGHFSSSCPQPKFEYFKKRSPRQPSKQKGMVANEEDKPMPVWIETDSETEQADVAEGAETALMAFTLDSDITPPAMSLKEPSFSNPSCVRTNHTVKVANHGEFAVYQCGDSFYTHLPTTNSLSNTDVVFSKSVSPRSSFKKEKVSYSDSIIKEYVPVDVIEEMNEMCKEYEISRNLNKKILVDLHNAQVQNSQLLTKVEELTNEVTEMSLLREEKIALEILNNKLHAQLQEREVEVNSLKRDLLNFTNSKATADTIIARQRHSFNHSGLGYKTGSVFCVGSTSGSKEDCEGLVSIHVEPTIKVSDDPVGKDYSKVQHQYPKNQTKRNRVAQPGSVNLVEKVSGGRDSEGFSANGNLSIEKVAENKYANGNPIAKKTTYAKSKQIKFVPASSQGQNVAPKEGLKKPSSIQQSSFCACFLCGESGHLATECLLRLITGVSEKRISKSHQVWTPKGN